jgi:hypothetical protein
MRRASAPALVAALALAAGCARCGAPRPIAPPERFLPASGSLSVVVPALRSAARQLGGLYRTASTFPGASQLVESHQALRAQLGFDPFDPKGLEEAGLAPAGGAGASAGEGRPLLLVLPLADLGRFDSLAQRLARDRLGAPDRVSSMGGGHPVVSFRRSASAPAALAYATVSGYVIVAAGPGGPEAVAAAATLPEEASLLRSVPYASARIAVGEEISGLAFAPRGSPLLSDLPAARDGAALAVRAGPAEVGLRLALLLAEERAPGWKAIAAEGPEAARQAGQEEARLLAPDAILAVRSGGDPAALGRRLVPFLPAGVRAALDAARLDLEGELLPALAPGAALSLSLAPTFTLAELTAPTLDPRRSDPFRLVKLEALLRVKDPARLRAFLLRAGQAAPRWGGKLAARGPAGAPVAWTLSYGRVQLSLALAGDRLAVAGGEGRLEELERRISGGGPGYAAPSPRARAALEGGLLGAVLDVGRLVDGVRALPDEAYGTGPNAFVMRSLADRLLQPASRLRAVSLRFDLVPGAALVALEVEARETPSPP